MLEFKEKITREEIPKQLWGNIFSPKDLKDVSPVPCRVVFLHPWDNFSLRNSFLEETEGVLTSSAWFEGCRSYHVDPPFLEGEVELKEKFSDSLDVFYSANQNNGRQIIYNFNSPEKKEYRDLYSYIAVPVYPCYDTWGPEKMLLLKLYKNQVKTLERVLYLVKKWKESGRRLIPSLQEFLVLMGDIDLDGNGGLYLPVMEFLEGVGYGELQGVTL